MLIDVTYRSNSVLFLYLYLDVQISISLFFVMFPIPFNCIPVNNYMFSSLLYGAFSLCCRVQSAADCLLFQTQTNKYIQDLVCRLRFSASHCYMVQ